MADVYMCAHCGSTYLEHQMASVQCLHCGNRTRLDGTKCPLEPVYDGENPHNRRSM